MCPCFEYSLSAYLVVLSLYPTHNSLACIVDAPNQLRHYARTCVREHTTNERGGRR